MIQGIDVSHWQNDHSTPQKIDFAKAVKMGVKFVFIKVSERGAIDHDFEYNWKAAKDAGILRGGYHFLRWDLSGLLQSHLFCDILDGDPGELPPVADFEAPNLGSLYPSNALLFQFLGEVETITHKKPMIYTSPNYWDIHGRNKYTHLFDAKWADYYLWIAHYMNPYTPGVSRPADIEPWKSTGKPWTFWQYTASGDGLAYGAESTAIDLNWFNGTLEDLKKLASSSTTPPPPASKPDIADLKSHVNQAIDDWAKTL
jgi:lysozyme